MSSEASSHVSFHHLFVNGALFVLTLHQVELAYVRLREITNSVSSIHSQVGYSGVC